MKRNVMVLLLLFLIPSTVWADCITTCPTTTEAGKPFIWVNEADLVAKETLGGNPTPNVVGLCCDTVWGFKERIYVVDPANPYTPPVPPTELITELYIQEGTIIKSGVPGDIPTSGLDYNLGAPVPMGQINQVGALVIAQGGYAEMIGDAEAPIVMTFWDDDVDDPYDVALPARGKWGGLIILGRVIVDCEDPDDPGSPCDEPIRHIEGIPEIDPDYRLSRYGCDIFATDPNLPCDDTDNSGIYQYISIRHGGYEIGAANEINGLTMGAVGDGTAIDHIEVFNNDDDGFEWFGGTANCRYLVSAMNKDDCFDYDQGFRGYGQFWFAITGTDKGDHAGEHDGQEIDYCRPFARPDIANVTYIGSGMDNLGQTDQTYTFLIRDNAGAHYANSIYIDFPQKYVKFEDINDNAPVSPCDYTDNAQQDTDMRCTCGDLTFSSTWWHHFGNPQSGAQWMGDWLFTNWPNNSESDPDLISYPPTKGNPNFNCRDLGNLHLYPVPFNTSPVLEVNGAILDGLIRLPDEADPQGCVGDLPAPGWYQKVSYAGAFPPNVPMWTDGWTFPLSGPIYTPLSRDPDW